MDPALARLVDHQAGVVARRQLSAAGLADHGVRRLVRRRDLTPVHRGVYVDHTGPLTEQQRRWAAVLAVWPAALCHVSALAQAGGRRLGPPDPDVHVAVDRSRRSLVSPSGVRVHHMTRLDERVRWNGSPPALRVEEATLDVAGDLVRRGADELSVLGLLTDVVGTRRTTAARLLDAVGTRSRFPRRLDLEAMLLDVQHGTCSVLEHGYLHRVELAHGLPPASRQVPIEGNSDPRYRDVDYAPYRLVVELDGRTFHARLDQHDLDLERDLDSLVGGRTTVRVGWGQVFRRQCTTALRIGTLLQASGWPGTVRRCPACPSTPIRGPRTTVPTSAVIW